MNRKEICEPAIEVVALRREKREYQQRRKGKEKQSGQSIRLWCVGRETEEHPATQCAQVTSQGKNYWKEGENMKSLSERRGSRSMIQGVRVLGRTSQAKTHLEPG